MVECAPPKPKQNTIQPNGRFVVLVQRRLNGGNFGGNSDFRKTKTIVLQRLPQLVRLRPGHQK